MTDLDLARPLTSWGWVAIYKTVAGMMSRPHQTHLTKMSSGHTSSSVPPSSSSSGDSYFYLARSSPIRISRSRWPGWPSDFPRVTVTPDPESSSPEARSHMDWDPSSEVPTEVGDEVYGRYVHRFPSEL